MTAETRIEWCDSTFNPWIGCTKISPACDHCYAAAQMDTRMGRVQWGAGNPRSRTSAAYWKQPVYWNRRPFVECIQCGWRGEQPPVLNNNGLQIGFSNMCPSCRDNRRGSGELKPARRRVFCASLADWLDNEAPIEWLVDLLDLIRRTPNLDWLLLSKRIGNWRNRVIDAGTHAASIPNLYLSAWLRKWFAGIEVPSNIWIGATICNQAEADRDIPKLLATPAAKRFLSIEPMLGPVDLRHLLRHQNPGLNIDALTGWTTRGQLGMAPGECSIGVSCSKELPALDWIICGGESGPHARPMHPQWARSLRDQCASAGVPFLFKQWGEWAPQIGAVDGWTIDDSPEISKFDHLEWEDGKWGEVFRPMWCDFQDGNYDEDHTVSRIGKKRAGRLLDGVEHNGVPA